MRSDKMVNLNVKYLLIDLLIITGVYAIAYFVTPVRFDTEAMLSYALMLPSFCMVYILFMNYYRMYDKQTFLYTDRVVKNTSLSFIFSTVMVFMFLFLSYNTTFSRLFLLIFISGSFIALIIEKLILQKLKKTISSRVDVIYVGNAGEKNNIYENFLLYTHLSGFNFFVLGYISTNGTDTDGEACLGEINDFEMILRQHPCDQVIFAQSIMEKWDLEPLLKITNEMGIISRILFDVYHIHNYKWYVSSLGLFPMLTYYNVLINPVMLAVKRLIDIIGSFVGIILSAFVMLITAIAIKIDTPGPVFFKQERVGLNGKKFNILKFRSMVIDAENLKQELIEQNEMGDSRLFKMKNDPRITRVGKIIRKTSIDEFPQFFNVLKGDMSLVGTRPPTVSEVEQYDRHHFRRISIKPGITGIWQTSGRNAITDFEQIVQMDTAYIDNWSLLLDIKLMLKTINVLFTKTGAY